VACLNPRWRSSTKGLKLTSSVKGPPADYARVALDAEKLARAKELAAESGRSDPRDARRAICWGVCCFTCKTTKGLENNSRQR